MAEIGDVQGFEKAYSQQLEKLRSADIDERDRKNIRSLVQQRNVNGIQKSTNVGTLNRCRLAAERAHKPLIEFDVDDYYGFHDALELDHDLADGTLRNYRKALKRYAEHTDLDWAEEVVIGRVATANDTIDPSKLLTDDEVSAMLDAAAGGRNAARDKAIMAMLRDSGMRVGALCNLRIHDVEFTESAGEYTVQDLPGNKDAEGTRPFTWARALLVNWLSVHPRPNDDDAPLFTKSDDDNIVSGPGEALSTGAVRKMLYTTANRADIDIDRERVRPHNWRDTTIADWKLDGLSDQQIKHRSHHVEDSDMLSRYGPLEDREMNESILEHYGIEEGTARTPDLEQCPQCGTSVRPGAHFCQQCGLAFDDAAREKLESVKSGARDHTVDEDDPGNRETLTKIAAAADVDPADVNALLD
ncbi:tyrosine-type recombinase/integrase [Halococcus hamelinensis]|uniref:Integrase family protein n=1 Tax=Halococcus hamelinensis 100A6 TaxID=1132509 RepID=M0LYJ2_9EURY|nr:tyrosine-type recombinase/integrase [Halococcus hamelinensis]EMA38491.1 integrase family protein [Halococcus hamelinensis 100A6]